MAKGALLLACGALARELVQLKRQNNWEYVKIQCLPAELHSTPDKIPGAVEEAIEKHGGNYDHIYVAYGDCGTGGALDRVLEKYGAERIPGAHCYEFFTGSSQFFEFADEEPGTFYLTDFMVRQFDHFVVKMLGLDRHPELHDMYFGNYKRGVYLSQERSEELSAEAKECAEYLGLDYEEHFTGLAPVGTILKEQEIKWLN
jgi:hypothetical protein